MKKDLIEKLNPANLTIEDAPTIESLGVEELELLGKTYPANVNFLEVENTETKVKFNTHYRALIWHKKNHPNAKFAIVSVTPTVVRQSPVAQVQQAPEKVVPAKPLVSEPAKEEPKSEGTEDIEPNVEGSEKTEGTEPSTGVVETATKEPKKEGEPKVEEPKKQAPPKNNQPKYNKKNGKKK